KMGRKLIWVRNGAKIITVHGDSVSDNLTTRAQSSPCLETAATYQRYQVADITFCHILLHSIVDIKLQISGFRSNHMWPLYFLFNDSEGKLWVGYSGHEDEEVIFWKHVSMLDRLEIRRYLEMVYALMYRKLVS
ncbi:hypothetical protein Tco_0784961, partial [Tanacetum coccineum]